MRWPKTTVNMRKLPIKSAPMTRDFEVMITSRTEGQGNKDEM